MFQLERHRLCRQLLLLAFMLPSPSWAANDPDNGAVEYYYDGYYIGMADMDGDEDNAIFKKFASGKNCTASKPSCSRITTQGECSNAASALTDDSDGTAELKDSNRYVSGCYFDSGEGKAFFNARETPTPCSGGSQCLCSCLLEKKKACKGERTKLEGIAFEFLLRVSSVDDMKAVGDCEVVLGELEIVDSSDIYDVEEGLLQIESIVRVKSSSTIAAGGTNPGGLKISGNAKLKSLRGLRQLQQLEGGLKIERNPNLASLHGLHQIVSLGHSEVKIMSNLEGFSILIHQNDALTSIAGLRGLNGNLAGAIIVSENAKLRSLDGLEGVTGVHGYGLYPEFAFGAAVFISENLELRSISALDNIQGDVGGSVVIKENPKLESLQGIFGIGKIGFKERGGYDGYGPIDKYNLWNPTHNGEKAFALFHAQDNFILCVTENEIQALRALIKRSNVKGRKGDAEKMVELVAHNWWSEERCQECPDRTCGESIPCDYHHGGRCMCPEGFARAGCTEPTSQVRLLQQHFLVLEPNARHTISEIEIPLLRTESNVEVTALEIEMAHQGTAQYQKGLSQDFELLQPVDSVTWTNNTHGYVTARIKTMHDEVFENNETFTLRLRHHSKLYPDSTLVGSLELNFTICDPPPGTVSFASGNYSEIESKSEAYIKLVRTGGTGGKLTIRVSVLEDETTAILDQDFTFLNRVEVTWDDGDDSPKALVIPLLNDPVYESPDKIIALHISDVPSPYERGSELQSTIVTILDDGDAGKVRFNGTGVERFSGDSSKVVVKVRFTTEMRYYPRGVEKAIPGIHFHFEEQLLSWEDGESGVKQVKSKFIDYEGEDTTKRAFVLELFDPTDGLNIDEAEATTVIRVFPSHYEDGGIGVVIGIISAILAIILGAFFRWKTRKVERESKIAISAVQNKAKAKVEKLEKAKDDVDKENIVLKQNLKAAQQVVDKVMEEGGTILNDLVKKIKYSDIYFEKTIGEGAFGTVYKGAWKGSTVAVKTVRSTKVTQEALRHFKGEIAVMAPLNHPNLVNMLGACWNDGPDKLCLVLEFCAKGSVKDILKQPNYTWSNNNYKLALGIAKCFKYLHHEQPNGKALIHRDLKPDNVLVSDELYAKVADFGESKQFDKEEANKLVRDLNDSDDEEGAPEIIKMLPYNEKVDVYSYSITLLELAIGERRFVKNQFIRVGMKAVSKGWRPKPPKTLTSKTPELWKLVQDCWKDYPSIRPSFAEIVGRLERADLDPRPKQGGAEINFKPTQGDYASLMAEKDELEQPALKGLEKLLSQILEKDAEIGKREAGAVTIATSSDERSAGEYSAQLCETLRSQIERYLKDADEEFGELRDRARSAETQAEQAKAELRDAKKQIEALQRKQQL